MVHGTRSWEDPQAFAVLTDGVQSQVAGALRRAIVSGLLQPGEALSETVLARRFGVSRTPVREALKQLERERLVAIVPRVGTYVRKATADEVLDALVVKEALEGAAARLLAQRPQAPEIAELGRVTRDLEQAAAGGDLPRVVEANQRFHELIHRGSASAKLQFHLELLLNEFRVPYQRLVSLTLSRPARLRRMLEEHRRIVAALAAHDPAEAERAMRAHVRAGREELRRVHLADGDGAPTPAAEANPPGKRAPARNPERA
ncbi:MAG TPA: GntR family transcriptional regulator [Methylomirabilota bacterium]|jgi:DNA-binding GntR family transcriptional regulator|nr:GntR family transcriptional regulator [Methylomirabilota bacterium]